MIITGLSQDLYLLNNPIWMELVELDPGTRFVEIVATNHETGITSSPIRIFKMGNRIRYDLQELIKGNFARPRHPQNAGNEQPLGTNYARFTVTVSERVQAGTDYSGLQGTDRSARGRGSGRNEIAEVEEGAVVSITRTFIRGGRWTMATNQVLKALEELRPTEKIPRWGSYPIARYYLGNDKRIYHARIVPEEMTDPRIVVGCEPLYVRFLNRYGGYSFWLFESYRERNMNNEGYDIGEGKEAWNTGLNGEIEVVAETKVTREYFELMRDLFSSAEVAFYERYGLEWAPVKVKGNAWEENNNENVKAVSIAFKVSNNLRASVIW